MTPLPCPLRAAIYHEMRRRAQLPPLDVIREDEAMLIVQRAEMERAAERVGRALQRATSP